MDSYHRTWEAVLVLNMTLFLILERKDTLHSMQHRRDRNTETLGREHVLFMNLAGKVSEGAQALL